MDHCINCICVDSLATADITAISAVIIALLSLIVVILQGYLTWRHNFLSVQPSLDVRKNLREDNLVSVTIYNNGLGPAILTLIEVVFSGNTYPIKKSSDITKILDNGMYNMLATGKDFNNTSLLAGGKYILYTIENSLENKQLHEYLRQKFREMIFKLEYKSLYNLKYKYSD